MNTIAQIFPMYFDWNNEKHPFVSFIEAIPKPTLSQLEHLEFDDEGPRDGLQGTLVYPGARDIHRYVDLSYQVGIRAITVGIFSEPGSRAEEITFSCLKYMAKKYADMVPIVVVRPLAPDLKFAKACYDLNTQTEILIFQGSSKPRLWVQNWTEESVLAGLGKAIDQINETCNGNSLATLEDATRATPEFISDFLKMSVQHTAKRVVFADTTGHLDPWGAYRFIQFARLTLDQLGEHGKNTQIDFHGHRDRSLDLPVALAAISAGATRIHGVVLGIGERSGNAVLDALLYNIVRMIEEMGGSHRFDLSKLTALCRQYAVMTNTPIPNHYPLIGAHAFLTAVGIHADAQEKGMLKLSALEENGDISESEKDIVRKTLRTIYTSIDHKQLGRIQRYLVGPLSGEATVRMWLYNQGYDLFSKEIADVAARIKSYAKQQNRVLRDEEIFELLERKGIRRTQQVQLQHTDHLG